MLIIDRNDKKVLLNHLKILKLYYRNQRQLFEGLQLGDAFIECSNSLEDLMNRIGCEQVEKE